MGGSINTFLGGVPFAKAESIVGTYVDYVL